MFNLYQLGLQALNLTKTVVHDSPSATLNPVSKVYKTGHLPLDHLLPHQGWAVGCVNELLVDNQGMVELLMLIPTLRQLSASHLTIYLLEAPSPAIVKLLTQYGIPESQLCFIGGKHPTEQHLLLSELVQQDRFGALILWAAEDRQDLLKMAHRLSSTAHGLIFALNHVQNKRNLDPNIIRLRVQADSIDELSVHLIDYRAKPISQVIRMTIQMHLNPEDTYHTRFRIPKHYVIHDSYMNAARTH